MNDENDQRPHLILQGITETDRFKSPRQIVPSPVVPNRDRPQHAASLRHALEDVKVAANTARQAQEVLGLEDDIGLRVEFESFPDVDLAFERLARERMGIELLNVRREDQRTLATVFVPDGRLTHFEKLIREYVEERKDRSGRRQDHRDLINAIQSIRAASLRALWTDDADAFPINEDEVLWWEVWLLIRGDQQATTASFVGLAEAQGLRVAPGKVTFPERTVLLVLASTAQMKQSMMTLNSIAELRRAKETAGFFDALPPEEHSAWVEGLLRRTEFAGADTEVPHVCVLDTGINRGHPLLADALEASDVHVVEPAWGTDDAEGHGSGMAGLALYGDLSSVLADTQPVKIGHRLESVKLLPHDGGNVREIIAIAADRQHGLRPLIVSHRMRTARGRPRDCSLFRQEMSKTQMLG